MKWYEGWYEDKSGEETGVFPLHMELTPNGKTLVCVYMNHEKIAEAVISKLGEPEYVGWGEKETNTLFLLFPHQNLPEELKDIAERMTTNSLLEYLSTER